MRSALRVALFAVVAGLSNSAAFAAGEFFSGNTLVKWAKADDRMQQGRGSQGDAMDYGQLYGYVVGVHDALSGISICSPSNATVGQIVAVVRKYLDARPEVWNFSADIVVSNALKETWPCAQQQKPSTQVPRTYY